MLELTPEIINECHRRVECTISEYLYETYNITLEDIESFISRFHNVKFKGFTSIQDANGVVHYYDRSVCFMSAGHGRFSSKVYKHWRTK